MVKTKNADNWNIRHKLIYKNYYSSDAIKTEGNIEYVIHNVHISFNLFIKHRLDKREKQYTAVYETGVYSTDSSLYVPSKKLELSLEAGTDEIIYYATPMSMHPDNPRRGIISSETISFIYNYQYSNEISIYLLNILNNLAENTFNELKAEFNLSDDYQTVKKNEKNNITLDFRIV